VERAARFVPNGSAPRSTSRASIPAALAPSPATGPLLGVAETLVLINNTLVAGNFLAPNDLAPMFVAYDPAQAEIFVTSQLLSGVTVVSDANLSVLATVPLPAAPFQIVYDSVRGTLFVSEPGADAVAVINATSEKVEAEVPVGSDPYGLAYDPLDGKVFVADQGSNATTVIDDATDAVLGSVGVGGAPYGAAFDAGKDEVYVTNPGSNNTSVISATTDKVVATVANPSAPYAVAYDRGRGEVFETEPKLVSGNVSVVNDTTNSVVATFAVGRLAFGIAYDPARGQVFVTRFGLLGGGQLEVFSDATDGLVADVAVGQYPYGVVYDAARSEVFVANNGLGTLSVVADSNDSVRAVVHLGRLPDAVTYDSGTGQLFVASQDPNELYVISDATDRVVHQIPLGAPPTALAYVPAQGEIDVATSTFTLFNPYGGGGLIVVNDSTDGVVATVPLGRDPVGVVYDAAEGELFVPDLYTGNVSVLNATTHTKVATVSLGALLTGATFDPAQDEVFVGESQFFGPGTVAIVSAASDTVVGNISVPEAPSALTYDAREGAVDAVVGNHLDVLNDTVDAVNDSILLNASPVALVADGPEAEVLGVDEFTDNLTVVSDRNTTAFARVQVGDLPVALALDPGNGRLYVVNEYQGTVSIVSFGAVSRVSFQESGLPPGTPWSVTMAGFTNSTEASLLGFAAPEGTYGYRASSVLGYVPKDGAGTLSVDGGNVTVLVRFFHASVIRFRQAGLPPGTEWSIVFAGSLRISRGSGFAWAQPNGTYSYSVTPDLWFSVDPGSGTVVLNGTNVTIALSFARLPTVRVTVLEKGFAPYCTPSSNCLWGVRVGYPARAFDTSGKSLAFEVPVGPVPYSAMAPPLYGLARVVGPDLPGQAGLNISGPATFTLHFARVYSLEFHETGLEAGTPWSVAIRSTLRSGGPPAQQRSGSGASLEFNVTQGSWKFSIVGPAGYKVHSGSSRVSVRGPESRSLTFRLVTAKVVFRETGLPAGTIWDVNVTGSGLTPTCLVSTSAAAGTCNLASGTYAFTIWTGGGQLATPSMGSFTVVAPKGQVERISFLP
jgi:YVTN family beta-propeller protein